MAQLAIRIRAGIRHRLLDRGYWLERNVESRDVRALLRELRPVTTPLPLERFGSAGDGGYLMPNDLDGIVACFSLGVADNSDFEYQIAERGIPCYLADYSVEQPPVSHPLFHFIRKYVGVTNDDMYLRMGTWIAECAPPTGDLLLQMDIEGAEWEVLRDIEETDQLRFRLIVLEVHFLNRIFTPDGFALRAPVLRKLLRHFEVVHIHANNCVPSTVSSGIEIAPIVEFTFVRRDRVLPVTPAKLSFPHPLDAPNVPAHPDLTIPAAWWAGE